LLAARLGYPAEGAPFRGGGTGRLELADNSLRVSLARSGPWCAVAISTGPQVGVDIEVIRADLEVDDVVGQFFPIRRKLECEAAAITEQPAVFFRWWVKLEAAARAVGRGLDAPPDCLLEAPRAECHALAGIALAVAAITASPTRGLGCPQRV
jgi:4'-phosphopantetheinyl transferase